MILMKTIHHLRVLEVFLTRKLLCLVRQFVYVLSYFKFNFPFYLGSLSDFGMVTAVGLNLICSAGELLVGKVKLEEEVALYKGTYYQGTFVLSTSFLERVDEAFAIVSKLLANLAIVNGMSFFRYSLFSCNLIACCKHEEEEVRKRDREIQRLKSINK